MAGTKAGGIKTRKKNLARNPNFYAEIGAIGGRNSTNGGFASDLSFHGKGCEMIVGPHHISSCAGMKGGKISKRPPAIKKQATVGV